jgi:ATP-binding cassette subfamily B protein RaxB
MTSKADYPKRSSIIPVIQTEAADCGLACISMLLGFFFQRNSFYELKQRYGSSLHGFSLLELNDILIDLGFGVRGISFDINAIRDVKVPAIIHWSGSHFVVLESVNSDEVVIIDPAIGRTVLSFAHAEKYITGYAIEVISPPSVNILLSSTHEEKGPSLAALVTTNKQLWPMMLLVGIGSVAVQILSLVDPYFISLVVDRAIENRDKSSLDLIVYIFAGFFAAKAVLAFINSRLQSTLSMTMSASLFSAVTRHLFHLSSSFFSQRSSVDIFARVRALEAVSNFFRSGVFDAPFTLLFLIISLFIVLYLATLPALVAVAFIVATLILEVPLQIRLERRQRAFLLADAEEQKIFVNSLLQIDRIKLNGDEAVVFAKLQNAQLERASHQREVDIAQSDISNVSGALHYAEKIVIVSLLASACIDGKLTIGLAVAFLLFVDEIRERLLGVIRVWSSYRSTRVQIGRVHEICVSKAEFSNTESVDSEYFNDFNSLVLSNVGFSYTKFGDPILSSVNVRINAGDKILIIGESGSGKSTLLRIISSLLSPTSGEILVNGKLLTSAVSKKYRQMIG